MSATTASSSPFWVRLFTAQRGYHTIFVYPGTMGKHKPRRCAERIEENTIVNQTLHFEFKKRRTGSLYRLPSPVIQLIQR